MLLVNVEYYVEESSVKLLPKNHSTKFVLFLARENHFCPKPKK